MKTGWFLCTSVHPKLKQKPAFLLFSRASRTAQTPCCEWSVIVWPRDENVQVHRKYNPLETHFMAVQMREFYHLRSRVKKQKQTIITNPDKLIQSE